jgi:hypothetical protein
MLLALLLTFAAPLLTIAAMIWCCLKKPAEKVRKQIREAVHSADRRRGFEVIVSDSVVFHATGATQTRTRR